MKREYGKTDIIICLKKIKKRLKEYQKIIVRLENSLHNDKMPYKIAVAKIFFVCASINF